MSKYGPPGCTAKHPEYKRHNIHCIRHGWIPWEEFAKRPKRPRHNPEPVRKGGNGIYGPPGALSGSRGYKLHADHCKRLGRWIPWDEYIYGGISKAAPTAPKATKAPPKYGPPGSVHGSPEVRRHQGYCYQHGWMDWETYLQRSEDGRKRRAPKLYLGKS